MRDWRWSRCSETSDLDAGKVDEDINMLVNAGGRERTAFEFGRCTTRPALNSSTSFPRLHHWRIIIGKLPPRETASSSPRAEAGRVGLRRAMSRYGIKRRTVMGRSMIRVAIVIGLGISVSAHGRRAAPGVACLLMAGESDGACTAAADGKPDLSGVWNPAAGFSTRSRAGSERARALRAVGEGRGPTSARRARSGARSRTPTARPRRAENPVGAGAWRIVQTDGIVSHPRGVQPLVAAFTDGRRKRQPDNAPTWHGYSTATWTATRSS